MKSRVLRTFVFSTAYFLVCLVPSLAFGQWHPDSTQNTPVCDTVGQQDLPQGCSDGANGAIVVWEDARSTAFQVYAQHIDMNGHVKWAKNGIKLATLTKGNYDQKAPIITTDDSGGAYIVWLDSRYSSTNGTCLFAQHLLASGALAYPDSGLPVAIGLNTGCLNPTLCNDGLGGAYVAWEDNRSSNATTRPDIWMNRLWPNSVKYGLTTTGTGTATTVNLGGHPTKYLTFFHDPNAHFKPYLVDLELTIPGKGSFQIASVTNDTQLTLKTYPAVGTYAYTVGNITGLPIDTITNKQNGPALINDGKGGCFLVWANGNTSPTSIYGTHLDSACTAWWDPAPQAGFKIYANSVPANTSRNVSLNRDGNQLFLTWQVLNTNNNSQEIYAQSMSCNTLKDTSLLWGSSAVDVTTDQILDQINPQIFSDDSADGGVKGAIIPFMNADPGSSNEYDVAMVRVLGNGGNLLPPAGNGFWFFEQNQQLNTDYQVVKTTDPANAGSNSGLLGVWTDAWDGKDTILYAQRLDRLGRKYFPTPGTSNRTGQAIAGSSNASHGWNARQPCLIPRTDGAIVAWTDFRNSTPDIYAQLILMDGSTWIPSDTTPPTLTVQSTTPSDNGNPCNSQCSTVLATDGGSLISGIDSIISTGMTNMQIDAPIFTKGTKSVTFTVCVIDSFKNATGTVIVRDTASNTSSMSFSYCTIADTSTPIITWDSIAAPNWLVAHVRDNDPWDRGIQSIIISDTINMNLSARGIVITPGTGAFDDTASIVDITKPASFAIRASGVAGKTTAVYTFEYTPSSTNAVTPTKGDPISISVYPNPVSGDATVLLTGAAMASVTVLDVLGRSVDQFRVEGSHALQASSLAPGTYIVRAVIGDVVVCKRIVRE